MQKSQPHNMPVALADAQLCSLLEDGLPLTPAVVSCSLLITFILKQIAVCGQPGGGQDGDAELPLRKTGGVINLLLHF